MSCTICGTILLPGEGTYLRRDWRRRNWIFCTTCVDTGRARKWGEKIEEKERQIE